ncbi:hypothetical protein [Pseudobacteriovorax antillogorgiicola]|uniref:DUF5017 domain-containing protein n=1 Tax=Pseudobacteriovorax antillogorgiicola TaxID=1513793 RepID=A0A1Y6C0M5_9BACT|nr:hypothetical protein [Pseudobacteriovorax antillogorgiicola]TCS51205.1 hypothetical protein EDD56_11189 [Pseudobacteriovorax antillogorgiicola]SMF37320.1 hypothetical protein SAMN06296036_11189 [Pseudobacteriovorax antillogorgiicola]
MKLYVLPICLGLLASCGGRDKSSESQIANVTIKELNAPESYNKVRLAASLEGDSSKAIDFVKEAEGNSNLEGDLELTAAIPVGRYQLELEYFRKEANSDVQRLIYSSGACSAQVRSAQNDNFFDLKAGSQDVEITVCDSDETPLATVVVEPSYYTGKGIIFSEVFDRGLGKFSNQTTPAESKIKWGKTDSRGTNFGRVWSKDAGDSVAWLLSDPIDLSEIDEPKLSFDYGVRFGADEVPEGTLSLKVSYNYDADNPQNATWHEIPLGTLPEKPSGATSYSDLASVTDADLSSFSGAADKSKVRLAFVFTQTEGFGWRVANISIKDPAAAESAD